MTLVPIKAGQFTMGSPKTEAHRDDGEDQLREDISIEIMEGTLLLSVHNG